MAKAAEDRYTSMAELACGIDGFSSIPFSESGISVHICTSPASGERRAPAGSSPLVGQFLVFSRKQDLAFSHPDFRVGRFTYAVTHTSTDVAEEIVAAGVLSVILLSAILYVAIKKGRNRFTAGATSVLSNTGR